MAKQTSRAAGGAKIRFIMLDAEVAEGDLNQITQAIQNAFRPNAIVQMRDPTSTSQRVIQGLSDATEPEDEVEQEDGEQLAPVTPRTSRPRKPTSPDVVDVDLKAEPSWEDFAKKHDPKSDVDKYLTVAAWFKECRGTNAISADHVYTCFRAVGWSTSIEDFSGPLRIAEEEQVNGKRRTGILRDKSFGRGPRRKTASHVALKQWSFSTLNLASILSDPQRRYCWSLGSCTLDVDLMCLTTRRCAMCFGEV